MNHYVGDAKETAQRVKTLQGDAEEMAQRVKTLRGDADERAHSSEGKDTYLLPSMMT